ncbi:hypothetical protein HHI36_019581 [Cryptolaemus montrouzieri]|uniref:MADF domain-containing protein n=1 Tax=Cryptolaemus montrouzieri TaxID=559131 RepID=A0ABD2N8J8_9CUCU
MNPIKLIKTIENFPSLWDKTDEHYRNYMRKEMCWQEIGKLMCEGWDKMTFKEKKERVITAKSKWRHIKDHFIKCLKKDNNGDPTRKSRKYHFFEELEFLRNSFEKKEPSRNFSELTKEEFEVSESDPGTSDEMIKKEYFEVSESVLADTTTQPVSLHNEQCSVGKPQTSENKMREIDLPPPYSNDNREPTENSESTKTS